MLYVSRITRGDRMAMHETQYGIVDSDDNVETLVTRAELFDIIFKMNLKVRGVSKAKKKDGTPTINVHPLNRATDKQTGRQVKAKVMIGADISVRRGQIIHISVSKGGQKIKLSNYGTSISWDVPIVFQTKDQKKVTLCLDDNITVLGEFKLDSRSDIIWDISAVQNEQFVEMIYTKADSMFITGCYAGDFLVDSVERYATRIRQQRVRGDGLNFLSDKCVSILRAAPPDCGVSLTPDEVRGFEDFVGRATQFHLENPNVFKLIRGIICSDLIYRELKPYGVEDFNYLRDRYMGVIFNWQSHATDALKDDSTVKSAKLLHAYIVVCDPDDHIKSLYVGLCNNLVSAVRAHDKSLDRKMGCRNCQMYKKCLTR